MEQGQTAWSNLDTAGQHTESSVTSISAISMAAETLIITANHDFAVWLSVNYKWNKQAHSLL